MTYRKTLTVMTTAAALTAGVMTFARAADAKSPTLVVTAPVEQVVRHVSYADLNLASARGVKMLNGRIDFAVSDLCTEATGGRDGSLRIAVEQQGCESGAWNSARPQIDRAVQRARDIAMTGSSPIAAAAIVIALPR